MKNILLLSLGLAFSAFFPSCENLLSREKGVKLDFKKNIHGDYEVFINGKQKITLVSGQESFVIFVKK